MRRLFPSSAALGLVAASALLLTGCFGGGSSKSAHRKVRPGKPLQQISIKESEWRLDPSKITFDQAGIYRFEAVNVGKRVHALAIEGPGGAAARTARIKPGQSTTVDVVVAKRGSYRFFDPVDRHRHKGMVGLATLG